MVVVEDNENEVDHVAGDNSFYNLPLLLVVVVDMVFPRRDSELDEEEEEEHPQLWPSSKIPETDLTLSLREFASSHPAATMGNENDCDCGGG